MEKQYIMGIKIGNTRTKMGLVETRDGNVIETRVSLTEKNNIDNFLSDIEHVLDIFSRKASALRGNIQGIRILFPINSDGESRLISSFGNFMEEQLLKNLIEKRFSLPCRIGDDDYAFALKF